MHCGLGPETVNTFLKSMNLRGMRSKNLKAREREIGPHIETAADESMGEALEDEHRFVLIYK